MPAGEGAQPAEILPATGARPLRRVLQRHIHDAVSEILIISTAATGARRARSRRIQVELENGALRFHAPDREMVVEQT